MSGQGRHAAACCGMTPCDHRAARKIQNARHRDFAELDFHELLTERGQGTSERPVEAALGVRVGNGSAHGARRAAEADSKPPPGGHGGVRG